MRALRRIWKTNVEAMREASLGEAQVVEYTRYFPPNVSAARLWLTNKRPKDWKVQWP